MLEQSGRFLYLVQHGEAKPEDEDPERPLTDEGKATVERVAEWAARFGIEVDAIHHSSKNRAGQTAEILAQKLQPAGGAKMAEGLGAKDDVHRVAAVMEVEDRTLMIVGHLPFLSRLASELLCGKPDNEIVRFRMGGIVCLAHEDGRWSIAFCVPPELV